MEATTRLDLTNKRILLVDDSLLSLKMVSMLFKRHGATVIDAVDGDVAVELVKQSLGPTIVASSLSRTAASSSSSSSSSSCQSLSGANSSTAIDMVIMDNLMPTMNGPDACRLMREAGFLRPIFGLTGHALPADVAWYQKQGANHIFTKPLDVSELVSVLAAEDAAAASMSVGVDVVMDVGDMV